MKKFTLLLFLLATITIGNAQSKYGWAKSYHGNGTLVPLSTAVDGVGNVYTAGYFSNEVDFDPGSGSMLITSAGDYDIFISKRDATGNLLWVKTIGDVNKEDFRAMAMDVSGNLYLTGSFKETLDFDPGPDTHFLSTVGSFQSDVFIVKLDANGEYVWAKSFTGDNFAQSNGIAVDGAGNVYTTGSFNGTVDFDPGATEQNITYTGGTNIFISKLTTDGDYVWAKTFGSATPAGHDGNAIAVDALGNVLTTGYFSGATDFDPGTGEAILNPGTRAIFFLKLNTTGDYVWVKQITRSSSSTSFSDVLPSSLAVDASGALYTSGWFQGTIDFDPDATGNQDLTAVGIEDSYIMKLDANGNYQWATRMGGAGDNGGNGISVDAVGNVYATGYFNGAIDADPGSATQMLSAADGADIYLVKLTTNGNFSWATSFGGGSDDIGMAITVTGLDDIYLAGTFSESVDLDPGTTTQNFTVPAGRSGAFIVHLPPVTPLSLTLLNFEAVDNNTTVQLHWQTTKEENMAGFTIERSTNGKQFEAIGSVAVNNSFNLVNNYKFTDVHPLGVTSFYRLKLNERNAPASYSRTIPVKRAGKANTLQVSPNPASNVLYVQIDAQEPITLQITDVTGHVVYQQNKTINGNTTFAVSLQGLPAGNYYLVIKGKTIQKTQQFLKH